MHRFNFKSAIFAGFIATVVMTIWMFFFHTDLMRSLGLAAGMQGSMVYAIGGLIHLGVGLFWGIIYAWLFEPRMRKLPGFLSGALFSLVPFIIALFFIGSFFNLIRMVFGNEQREANMGMVNSYYVQEIAGGCATCPKAQPKAKKEAPKVRTQRTNGSSCYPCYMDGECAPCGACMPCSPDATCTPCSPETMCEPCYPDDTCTPCAPSTMSSPSQNRGPAKGYGSGAMPNLYNKSSCVGKMCGKFGLPLWLWSLINHLVYGVTLGLIYRPHRQKAK